MATENLTPNSSPEPEPLSKEQREAAIQTLRMMQAQRNNFRPDVITLTAPPTPPMEIYVARDLLTLDLLERLQALEVAAGTWPGMPESCRAHTCDYYTAYLAYGAPELVHEGYHAAERQYEAATKRYEEHCNTCISCREHFGHCMIERKLGEHCQNWETRLRA